MSTVRNSTSSIESLTGQALHIEARQAKMESNGGSRPDFESIRQRAQSFYSALRSSWSCQCKTQHVVSLRLEARMNDLGSHKAHVHDPASDQFNVLFRYGHRPPLNIDGARPWDWDEADVRVFLEPAVSIGTIAHTSDSRSTKKVRFAQQVAQAAVEAALEEKPNLQPITDLCSAIHALQSPHRDVCFSLIKDQIVRQRYGFVVYPKKTQPFDTVHWSVSSLRSAFTTGMTRRDRLQLAVTLASSVLQLSETAWLDDDWSIDNIFFVNRPGVNAYQYPFVAGKFDRSAYTSRKTVPPSLSYVVPNCILYGLGIALIELWHGKTLDELHLSTDGLRHPNDMQRDFLTLFNTACRLVSELADEAGELYSDAARRCIRCDFNARARSFQDSDFQLAVYLGVVAQLKMNYDFLHKTQTGRQN